MATLSNNDIARAIYLASKEESAGEAVFLKNVVDFLNKKRLLAKAPEILEALRRIINKEQDVLMAKVSSVVKLEHSLKNEIEEFLKKRYKSRGVELVEMIDARLVGGYKIEVGDEVIDFSIKNKIEKLQTHLNK